jgi:hypothetical protein
MAGLADGIAVDPAMCGRRLCIRGLRVRVKDILAMLAGGATRAEILRDDPCRQMRTSSRRSSSRRPPLITRSLPPPGREVLRRRQSASGIGAMARVYGHEACSRYWPSAHDGRRHMAACPRPERLHRDKASGFRPPAGARPDRPGRRLDPHPQCGPADIVSATSHRFAGSCRGDRTGDRIIDVR